MHHGVQLPFIWSTLFLTHCVYISITWFIAFIHVVAEQASPGVRPSGRTFRQRLFGHGQPGGWLGRYNSGMILFQHDVSIQFDRWLVKAHHVSVCAFMFIGGVIGTAAVRSVLPHFWWISAARRERVAFVWSSLQPPRCSDAGESGQWLYACLSAVPRLCAPGELVCYMMCNTTIENVKNTLSTTTRPGFSSASYPDSSCALNPAL